MVLKDMALPLVALNLVLICVATIMVVLRCWVRLSRQSFGLDDYLMVLGYVLFAITVGMSTAGAYNGLGVHNYGSVPNSKGLMYYAFWQIFYVTSTAPVKSSVCVSLMRITPVISYKRILWGIIIASSITPIIADIVVFTYCIPMEYTWNKKIKGHCNSLNAVIDLSYLVSAINIITDWSCAIIPWFVLWNVQMNRRVKVSVCIMLGMGIFASTATLVRLKTISAYRNTNDYLYAVAEIAVWSALEVGLAVIAGSASTLRPLLRLMMGSSSDDSNHTEPLAGPYLRSRSIQLRDVRGGMTEATIHGGGDKSSDSIPSEDGTTSQRGILKREEKGADKNPGKSGIMITQAYVIQSSSAEQEDRDNFGRKDSGRVGGLRRSSIEELV